MRKARGYVQHYDRHRCRSTDNGISSYDDTLIAPFDGTLNLIGGTVQKTMGRQYQTPTITT